MDRSNRTDRCPATAAIAARTPSPRRMASEIDPYYWLRDDERQNPRGAGLPRGGERYGNAHGGGQAASGHALRGNRRAPETGRCQRAISQARLLVPHPLRAGQGAPDIRAPQGLAGRPEEILLDAQRALRPAWGGTDYYRIGALEVSPDGGWLAFCEDTVGRRQYTLRFKNLRSGRDSRRTRSPMSSPTSPGPTTTERCCTSKRIPRPCSAYTSRSTCWDGPAAGALVFEQTDKSFYTGVTKSKSDRFIFIHMESTVSSEWRYAAGRRSRARVQDLPAARARSRIPDGTSRRSASSSEPTGRPAIFA